MSPNEEGWRTVKDIDSIVIRLAGDPSRIGYHYLARCAGTAAEKGYPYRNLMKLYQEVADECGMTAADVSREAARAAVGF